jgi:predicted Zn-dependent peptidase
MVKKRIRAGLIRGLANNGGIASTFAFIQTRYQDWRELFRSVDRVDKVSKADIRRVANKIFVASNRTTGMLENAPPTAAPQQGANQ